MREQYVDKIVKERERHYLLPGTERDVLKSPNDWIATICSLLGETVDRIDIPNSSEFEKSLIKVAAVSLAALEHIEIMEQNKKLRKGE